MCNVCDAGRVIEQRDHARFQVGPATLFVSVRAVDGVEMRAEFTPCEVKVRRELPEREPVETSWFRAADLAGVMSALGTAIKFEYAEHTTGYAWVTGQTDDTEWCVRHAAPPERKPRKRGWKKAQERRERASMLRRAKSFEKLLGVPAFRVGPRSARFVVYGHTITLYVWRQAHISHGPMKGLSGKAKAVAAAVRAYEAAWESRRTRDG